MATIVNARIKNKRGTEESVPILLDGEFYYCTDTHNVLVGTSSGKNNKLNEELIKKIGSSEMGTTATDLTGAIAENHFNLTKKLTKSENDINYYVNGSTGNDSNDGLSIEKSFKTINHAISLIPDKINNNITINVKNVNGESVTITGYIGGGNLKIISENITDNILNSIYISDCYVGLQIYRIQIECNNNGVACYVKHCSCCTIESCSIKHTNELGNTSIGVGAEITSCSLLNNTISNCFCAIVSNQSLCFSNNNTGETNTVGLQSINGGIIGKYYNQPTGTTSEFVVGGGVIR